MTRLEALTVELEALILAAKGAKLTEFQAGYIAAMSNVIQIVRGKV